MKLKIFTILIIFMFFSKKGFSENYDKVLYDFKIESITGEVIDLNEFKNKVVLITNTASYCGFTKQYSDLQKLWQKYKEEGPLKDCWLTTMVSSPISLGNSI